MDGSCSWVSICGLRFSFMQRVYKQISWNLESLPLFPLTVSETLLRCSATSICWVELDRLTLNIKMRVDHSNAWSLSSTKLTDIQSSFHWPLLPPTNYQTLNFLYRSRISTKTNESGVCNSARNGTAASAELYSSANCTAQKGGWETFN